MLGEQVSALAWKKPLNLSAQDLKTQWEIQFSTFFVLVKTLRIFFFYNRNIDLLISNLLSISIMDIGKWSNWKYTQIHIRVFSVWPLPQVHNWFQKHFWNKKVLISIVKKSVLTKKKIKIGFPIVFLNLARKGLGFFFHARALIFSPNALYLLNSRGGRAPNFWFWLHPFIRIVNVDLHGFCSSSYLPELNLMIIYRRAIYGGTLSTVTINL